MTKHRILDKDKVIAKATEIINNEGLSALTMPHLAQELNIRSQSLYHYVANRQELLSLVCVKRLQVLRQQLLQEIVGLSGREAMFAFADEIRNFLLNDHAMSSIFYNIDEIGNNSGVKQEVHQIVKLGEKLDVDNKNIVSLHGLLAAVLGYVFLDRSHMFEHETEKQSNDNYHQLLLRLVAPKEKVS
ncbi:TetR/AcrR family transcriptional regulator [Lactobacillus colini]|uniref:TetR/AcrR family transcriptional regulator n=1 Tax=Lactobacillus colini TaxID=1819254 RepID=UPI001AE2FA2F